MKKKLSLKNRLQQKILTLLLIAPAILTVKFTNAQTAVSAINEDLRNLFSGLQRPSPSRLFLYEMACHMADSNWFVPVNTTDTLDTDSWFKMYEEMRNCAYDTSAMLRHDTVYTRSGQYYADTINMMVMGYDYYTFIDSALTTNVYFDFDTINNTITDRFPRPGYPFNINTVFAAAPNKHESYSATVVFRIDRDFIFRDAFSALNTELFKIDFGDGTGWHYFDPNTVTYYTATYSSIAGYIIQAEVESRRSGALLLHSRSILQIYAESGTTPPDEVFVTPGIIASAYFPCDPSVAEPYEKVIIYVEGIDVMDFLPMANRTGPQIYEDQIRENGLGDLRNFGYTYVVVDWINSRQDMRINALFLEDLIIQLKCKHCAHDICEHEQFVVMGESMGGLIARYALRHMELQPKGCSPEKLHNTRLLITLDSPNKGANVPLALQHFYRVLGNGLLTDVNTITQATVGMAGNLFLDAMAARQMLLYHVNTYNPGLMYSPYGPDPAKALFDAELAAMGNYPKYCKTMGMSNGSIAGLGQTRIWDGNLRNPNDRLLYLESEVFVRILHFPRIKIGGFKIDLRTTPQGQGNIATVEAGTWSIKVKVKLFGVKIVKSFNSLLAKYYDGITLPVDISPGGVYAVFSDFSFPANNPGARIFTGLNRMFFGNGTQFNSLGSGNYAVGGGQGGWFAGLSTYTKFGSDGFHWNFIPTPSGLDYPPTSLNPNIEGENINVKTTIQPFGVITGITKSYPHGRPDLSVYRHNRDHLFPRNDTLTNSGNHLFYDACGNNNPIMMLNREIGDDKLYVENRILRWRGQYTIEKQININERNPHYEYPGFATPDRVEGVYSKDKPLIIVPFPGWGVFRAQASNVVYHPPMTGPYTVAPIGWSRCCNNYYLRLGDYAENSNPTAKPDDRLMVSPNPVLDGQLIVRYKSGETEQGVLRLLDIYGKELFTMPLSHESEGYTTYPIDISHLGLAAGSYIVVVQNGNEQLRDVLIVH